MLSLRTTFIAISLLLTSVHGLAIPNQSNSTNEGRDKSLVTRAAEPCTNWGIARCVPNGNLQQCTYAGMYKFAWLEVPCANGCGGPSGMLKCL